MLTEQDYTNLGEEGGKQLFVSFLSQGFTSRRFDQLQQRFLDKDPLLLDRFASSELYSFIETLDVMQGQIAMDDEILDKEPILSGIAAAKAFVQAEIDTKVDDEE